MSTATPPRAPAGLVVLAALADLACVLALASGGLAAHTPGEGVVRLLYVAWPFAAGALAGWLVTRAWRRPWRLWPTGVVVWGCAWALGVLLRVLTGQGVAPAFQLVSFGVLGVTLLGWRGVVALVEVLRPSDRRRRERELSGR
jgi:peptidoglycan/LPS O-acetylase OafA/YrhL